jgi:hypothetical protein
VRGDGSATSQGAKFKIQYNGAGHRFAGPRALLGLSADASGSANRTRHSSISGWYCSTLPSWRMK